MKDHVSLSGSSRSIDARILVIAITILALCVRLVGLTDPPIWLDEAYSVWFSQQDWSYLWGEVPEFETHPPFYYSILKIWRSLAGSSEWALRMPSVIASTAVIPLLYASARNAFDGKDGERVGILAALLGAVWIFQIGYAQQARPYGFVSLAAAITLCAITWIIAHRGRLEGKLQTLFAKDRTALFALVGMAIGLAAMLWLHNLNTIPVALTGFFMLGWALVSGRGGPHLLFNVAFGLTLGALLYSYNLPTLWNQLTSFGQGFWLREPGLFQLLASSLKMYGQISANELAAVLGRKAAALIAALIALASIGGGVLGLLRLCRQHGASPIAVYCLLIGFAPWLIIVAMTYISKPVFLNRTLIASTIPVIFILAALPWCGPRGLRIPGLVLVLGLVSVGLYNPLSRLDFAGAPETGNRKFVSLVQQSGLTDAPVVIFPNAAALTFNYYAMRQALPNPVMPVPGPFPVRDARYAYPSGGKGVPEVTVLDAQRLAQNVSSHSSVFVIVRSRSVFDPERNLERALTRYFPCQQELYSFAGELMRRFDANCARSPAITQRPKRLPQ